MGISQTRLETSIIMQGITLFTLLAVLCYGFSSGLPRTLIQSRTSMPKSSRNGCSPDCIDCICNGEIMKNNMDKPLRKKRSTNPLVKAITRIVSQYPKECFNENDDNICHNLNNLRKIRNN